MDKFEQWDNCLTMNFLVILMCSCSLRGLECDTLNAFSDMSQSYFPTRLVIWTWLEVPWSQCIDLISTLVHLAKFRNIFICRSLIEFHRKEADGYFWRFEMKIMLSVDKNGKIDTFILLIWILMNIWLVWFWPLVISFPFFDITGEH